MRLRRYSFLKIFRYAIMSTLFLKYEAFGASHKIKGVERLNVLE